MGEQIGRCDRVEGDLDTLSTRLAHIVPVYVANRNDWLDDPQHWQEHARRRPPVSALHMKLMGQFVKELFCPDAATAG